MDDDGLVLNIASTEESSVTKSTGKKGGRWTDRLKAKRAVKRKSRVEEKTDNQPSHTEEPPRPVKRIRREPPSTHDNPPRISSKPTQIISSLFSYNPTVDTPVQPRPSKQLAKPSNAPLTDASTFNGLGLNPLISSHLSSKMGIEKPTAIQRSTLAGVLPEANASRDIFIQSQTGSGKTLSYLLPIIQDLLPLSSLSYIDRSIGTLAVIIAPTRELAKQISDVLEELLKMRLRPEDENPDDADATSSSRLTRWLVSGLLTGGGTRTHEKARLRKGIPILVSTPGRLLDHLQNTSSFNVGKCRWLVLDEADRLMELGFEETVTGIIRGLDGRRKLAMQAVEEGNSMEVGGWDWSKRRRTMLCSATIREDVQKLAGTTLSQPLMIKATEVDRDIIPAVQENKSAATSESFTPPSQLSQKYVIVPLKLRLVSLVALLRTLAGNSNQHGSKIIVFFSCTDSVDFHWALLGGSNMEKEASDEDSDDEEAKKVVTSDQVKVQSPLLPDTAIFRLHGSLPTKSRQASLKGFVGAKKGKAAPSHSTSVLFCTSVASRGLDLPLVRAVVQYDLPTEGGTTEYVHRVGRTARAGKGGEAWSMVAPSEAEWVKWAEESMQGQHAKDGKGEIKLTGVSTESILASGFGGKGSEYEARATEVQLSFERWVLGAKENAALARKAYLSHMRAYATHPANEKHIFHIRHLHVGHLAKAFALRDAPNMVSAHSQKQASTKKKDFKRKGLAKEVVVEQTGEAERRMQEVVRAQGRLWRKGGAMISSGTSEFQVAGGATLEKLVNSKV